MRPSVRRVVNGVAALTIVAGPIVAAAWRVHGVAEGRYPPVVPVNATGAVDGVLLATDAAAARAAAYLERRNALVDKLLPEGVGGTRFVTWLDGNAGQAHAVIATVMIAATGVTLDKAEAVELHERAHLFHLLAPRAVAPLLRRIGPPDPGQYAAKNSGEHFAEMAELAWEFVAPPSDVCFVDPPTDRLREVDEIVPGTAGFVAWYLRQPALADLRDRESLLAIAEELIAPLRAEWEVVWGALGERRRSDETFEPWPRPTIRGVVEGNYLVARGSRSWLDRMYTAGLLPSLAVVKLLR